MQWDERYAGTDYLFGTAPNDFLVEVSDQLTLGEVLCLADGEGRNGVYLAGLGHRVTAVDGSTVALNKARSLAEQHAVTLTFTQADLSDYNLGHECWDSCVSIFFHMPPVLRHAVHRRVVDSLKPGGLLVLEAYRPEQLIFKTGGPTVADMLMTLTLLEQDFYDLKWLHATEKERVVIEGTGHTGEAAVVQLLARKSA